MFTNEFDGVVVYTTQCGVISSDSQYYCLNDFANGVQPGSSDEIFIPASDPSMPDSDEDGFMDYEDARPNVVNPDMIYVFANPDFENSAANRANMYRNCGKSVRFISFSDIDSFQNAWNGIGLYDEYYIDGESFTFNVKFQKWLKSNAGKTYADAVEAYKEIKKDKGGRKNIDSQFEYNT